MNGEYGHVRVGEVRRWSVYFLGYPQLVSKVIAPLGQVLCDQHKH